MRLVGIAGKAQAGKSTIAKWLGQNRNAFSFGFAHPMKSVLIALFGLTREHFEDPVLKETPLPGIGRSPRYLAQTLGTEWGRELVHPDVWVMAVEQQLKLWKIWETDVIAVAQDLRFENEAAWIRKNGGLVLHVYRQGADGNVGISGHASEKGIELAGSDIVIENNGTLEQLHEKLAVIFP